MVRAGFPYLYILMKIPAYFDEITCIYWYSDEITCIFWDGSENKHDAGEKPDANGSHSWKKVFVKMKLVFKKKGKV